MPPSTLPSISQITVPYLLEVRTPLAFSYLGKYREKKTMAQQLARFFLKDVLRSLVGIRLQATLNIV